MRLNPEDLQVVSFAIAQGGFEAGVASGVNTCASCNLSNDDFTCADYCSSRPPGLTCYFSCDCESQ